MSTTDDRTPEAREALRERVQAALDDPTNRVRLMSGGAIRGVPETLLLDMLALLDAAQGEGSQV